MAEMKQWIERDIANEIYENLLDVSSYWIYYITADAGAGKSYLARELGTRFNSEDGYSAAIIDRYIWLGIFDLYDPDTNSNYGVERRIIAALKEVLEWEDELEFEFAFEKYDQERALYDSLYKQGIRGGALEKQRQSVQAAFSEGLNVFGEKYHLIFVFDTTERLEGSYDPIEKEEGFTKDSVGITGWILYQISHLRKGNMVFLGRPAQNLRELLEVSIEEENQKREKGEIKFSQVSLGNFSKGETARFFEHRVLQHEKKELGKVLSSDLKDLMQKVLDGKPLQLDLALQVLLESKNLKFVSEKLQERKIEELDRYLISLYHSSLQKNSTRQVALTYLAQARNGLSAEMLKALDPKRHEELAKELVDMEELPFIKVRNISMPEGLQRMYFLHDYMYQICDAVFLKPGQIRMFSKKMVQWYGEKIMVYQKQEEKEAIKTSKVDSLFYRMRSDLVRGYQWYLQETDLAIRSTQTGLDMSLKTAMALFMLSSSEKDSGNFELNSILDKELVDVNMPQLPDLHFIESVTLWCRRLILRGGYYQAVDLGKKHQLEIERIYHKAPDEYLLPYCEFLLWYGQSVMYVRESEDAEHIYDQAKKLLEAKGEKTFSKGGFDQWRYSLVMGRLYNNLGYTKWIYQGRYSLAMRYFNDAVHSYQLNPLPNGVSVKEEFANSLDNLARVKALVGKEFEADTLARRARTTREQLGLTYRVALSNVSMGLIHIRFNRYESAEKSLEKAYTLFKRIGVNKRGFGLVEIARANLYRAMANDTDVMEISNSEALEYADKAEAAALEAVEIFRDHVHEPIRLVQAYNELASCYRTRVALLTDNKLAEPGVVDMAYNQCRVFYRKALEIAEEHKYRIEVLDILQDIAVLYVRRGEYVQAKKYLRRVKDGLPPEYRFKPGKTYEEVPEEERIDVYYNYIGLVEMLEGEITYGENNGNPDKYQWVEMFRQYLLAIAYLNLFSHQTHTKRILYGRVQKRFMHCSSKIIEEIIDEMVPKWKQEYDIPDSLIDETVEAVFDSLF